MGDQWSNPWPLGMPMLSREQRNPLSEWWWTVDRLQLAAGIPAVPGGTLPPRAARHPAARRVGLHPLHLLQSPALVPPAPFLLLCRVPVLSAPHLLPPG